MSDSLYIEIGSHQEHKHSENCFGDSVTSKKIAGRATDNNCFV